MSYYSTKHYIRKTPEENFQDRLIYLEYLAQDRPGRHLDIGCSIGNFVNLDPDRIEGIDVDEDALGICRERGLNCKQFNIEDQEFPEREWYDVVYFRHIIEHMQDPLAVLKKLRDILKKDGLLIVETPDYVEAHHRKKSNFWDDYTHRKPFTFNSLERISFDAGFDIIHKTHKPHYGYWVKQFLRRGWLNHETVFKWHLLLNLVRSDLLFVLKKPA